MVDRLYRESFERIISKSRLFTKYSHTLSPQSSVLNESCQSTRKASKRKISEILERLKSEDARKEFNIMELRKAKRSKDAQEFEDILNCNVSKGKISL